MPKEYFVGIDCGTSGMRAVVIDSSGKSVFETAKSMAPPVRNADGSITQRPLDWALCFDRLVAELPLPRQLKAIAIDGTSGTILLVDEQGRPLTPGHMYNDPSAGDLAADIADLAPAESAAHGATSPAARLLMLQGRHPQAHSMLHQADWLAHRLTGRMGISDDNNALKTGWDPITRAWPDWLDQFGIERHLLPAVVSPGEPMGEVLSGPLKGAQVIAGTTDGCASFLATGANQPGDGVSALGSTLTIKFLASAPIFAPKFGIYSHRIGDRWLAGGASNSGGDALGRFFSGEQITELSEQIDPNIARHLGWHPLPRTGERFPVNDPDMKFDAAERPADDAAFLQLLLEGVASVEAMAYSRLAELGKTTLASVRSVGTGAGNATWSVIRARHLDVELKPTASAQAAYGTARLAAGLIA